MLSKTAWKLIASSDFSASVLKAHFLTPSGVPRDSYFRSSVWSSIKTIYVSLWEDVRWFIGSASNLKFWTDEWIIPPLASQLCIPFHEQKHLTASVSDYLTDNRWKLSQLNISAVKDQILGIKSLKNEGDVCVWTVVSDVFILLRKFTIL